MDDSRRKAVTDEIIERELAMFLATQNLGGQSDCQKRPDAFRLMRAMAHSAHGLEFLDSYLADLREAEKSGRNFMVEKYARMDNLIPPLSDSPLLDEIADAEAAFMEQAAEKLPGIVRNDGSSMFKNYLRCELETLSPASLEFYAREIRDALKNFRNPVLERHKWLQARLAEKPADKNC